MMMKECTPENLIHAVQYGDFVFVETAIENYGMSPNFCDKDGCTLLHWAAINNRLQVAKYLVSRQGNVNSVGGMNGEIPLQWAVRHPKGLSMVYFLLCEGSNVHHKSVHGYDALFLAVQHGFVDTVFILLNHGSDPNTTNFDGDTPFYWSLRFDDKVSNIEIQRLLISFDASVDQPNNEQEVALHILAKSQSEFDSTVALLAYGDGSSMNAENKDGLTPYQIALRNRNFVMTAFAYDAYLYTRFPKWLPIATTALTFAGYFVILYYKAYNIWGFSLAAALIWIESKLAQQTIIRASSRRSCGFAWGIILTVVTSYYVHFACSTRSAGRVAFAPSSVGTIGDQMSWQCNFVGNAFALSIVYTLLATMNTPPQSLPRNTCHASDYEARKNLVDRLLSAKSAEDQPSNANDSQFRLCTTCLVDKSAASVHCGSCNACMVNMDHHCPFVNNCVGRGNRRVFVLFTLFASLGCLFFAVVSFWMQYNLLCDAKQNSKEIWWQLVDLHICMVFDNPSLIAATYLSAFTSVWIFGIFVGQVSMIATETTTFEVMKRKNYGTFGCLRGFRNVVWFCWSGKFSIAPPRAGAGSGGKACCSGHASDGPNNLNGEGKCNGSGNSSSTGSNIGSNSGEISFGTREQKAV